MLTSSPSPLLYPCFSLCFYIFFFAQQPKACSCVHCTGAASDKKRCACYCGRLEESAQIGAGQTHGKYNIGRFYILFDGWMTNTEIYFDCNAQHMLVFYNNILYIDTFMAIGYTFILYYN